jgi:cell division protein FtsW (lipid II flippase)
VITTALLHPDHRRLAWAGGLLLAAATWVRLYDVGVQAPEAYTLPTAVVLLLVGLHRLRTDPEAGTVPTLLAGLSLATVPTLLWALVDPLSARAVVIGLACLVLVVGGSALRWTAPVLVGWLGGAALVLRELAPYAEQTPQWVIIGAAGVVLVTSGITWEARVRDLRQAAAYLGRLR